MTHRKDISLDPKATHYCEVTPCDCSCHHGTPPDPEIGAKLAS